MFKKITPSTWYEILLIAAVLAVHLYAATSDAFNFPASWFTRDDAYYYFKVAQNITEGHGITFDGVSPTNGYHPLWMLVNIPIFALARFDLILPLRILLMVQAALSAGTAVLIFRLVKGTVSPALGVLASAWWATDLYIHYAMYEYGLETGLASFTVTLLVYQLWKFERTWRTSAVDLRQVAGLALVAVLAMFSRLDLVFLAVLAGAWILLRGTRLRILAPLDVLLAVISVPASFIYRLGLPEYYLYTDPAVVMLAVSVTTKILLYFLLGLYQPPVSEPFGQTLKKLVLAVSASTFITGMVMLVGAPLLGSFPRIALVYDWLLNLAGMILLRTLARAFSQNVDRSVIPPLDLIKRDWAKWLREGGVYYGILGGFLAAYLAFNKLFIGSAMPVSGEIKRWWGTFGSKVYGGVARSPLSFWGVDFNNDFNAWRPFTGWLARLGSRIGDMRGDYRVDGYFVSVLIALLILWLFILLLNRRQAVRAATQFSLPLLLIASFAQVLSYNLTGYAALKEWYWIIQPLLVVLAFSLAAGILLRPFMKYRLGQVLVWLGVTAILLPQAWTFTSVIMERMPHGVYGPGLPYLDSVRFLEENTPPGALIGMTGGGNVGYYIQNRTIVNMDGLINSPAYFEALQAGQANTYLQGIGLDYIFANPGILKAVPYRNQYALGPVIGRYGGKSLMEFTP
ncbi:MAG: hypothetical protein HY869_14350 [Chloroflexi bacterium]|nr:hypothetical protein [Chloroflexota bacterium]